jgi:hypothetical protein
MDIEMLLRRQEVLAWRDELVLGIWRLVNRAGVEAKRGVESHLAEAGLVDALWDPANFTRDRVDGVMRAAILGGLDSLFTIAAEDLRAIDRNFGALADALLESLTSLRLPAMEDSSDAASMEPSATPTPSGRLSSAMEAVSRQDLVKSARDWGSWALDMVGEASDVASQKLQSGTGLHDRLRRSAQARIDTAWMASVGDPPPLMGQLISAVETVGSEAKSMAR